MTSKDEVKDVDPAYKTIKFGYRDRLQYHALSYIDFNEILCKYGTVSKALYANSLFSYSNFCDYMFKINTFYKFYHSRQVLFQNDTKTIIESKKTLPQTLLYNEETCNNPQEILKKLENVSYDKISTEINKAVNEVLILKYSEIYYFLKKEPEHLIFENRIRPFFDSLKEL